MRFLFECVGCYTLSSPCTEDEQSMPPLTKSEETRSLVAATAAAAEVGRRRKKASPRAHAADWRPSLFAIAEDNNATPKPAADNLRHRGAVAASVVAKRSVQRCGSSLGGGGGGVGASRSHTLDYRHDHVPIVVPAFSAPFLF